MFDLFRLKNNIWHYISSQWFEPYLRIKRVFSETKARNPLVRITWKLSSYCNKNCYLVDMASNLKLWRCVLLISLFIGECNCRSWRKGDQVSVLLYKSTYERLKEFHYLLLRQSREWVWRKKEVKETSFFTLECLAVYLQLGLDSKDMLFP